jgi:cbb3-type cytochrome oxidase subunit 3
MMTLAGIVSLGIIVFAYAKVRRQRLAAAAARS